MKSTLSAHGVKPYCTFNLQAHLGTNTGGTDYGVCGISLFSHGDVKAGEYAFQFGLILSRIANCVDINLINRKQFSKHCMCASF